MSNACANDHTFQVHMGQHDGPPRVLQANGGDRFQELISLRDCEIDDLSQQLFLSQQEVRKGQQRERELQVWKDQATLEIQGLEQQVHTRDEQIMSMGSTIESLQQRLAQFSSSFAGSSSVNASAHLLIEPDPSCVDSLSRSLPASPSHNIGSTSSRGSGGSSPDPVSEQDAPEDALRNRQDNVFLMQEQIRKQIALHRSSYADGTDKTIASCSPTHGALPSGRVLSPPIEAVSAQQDTQRAAEEFQAVFEQNSSVQISAPPPRPRASSIGRRERSLSRGAAERGSVTQDERILRPMPRPSASGALLSGRATSPRPEPTHAQHDPSPPEVVVHPRFAQIQPAHEEQNALSSVPDERPLRPMPSGGMLVPSATHDALPTNTAVCRERSSSRSTPADCSVAAIDDRPLRPMPSGGSLVSLATSFFDESPEELAQRKAKQQKVARQIEQRRQRQSAAVTASPASVKAGKCARPAEEQVPAETTRKPDSMLSHTKSVPTGLLAGRAAVVARPAHGSPAQTSRAVHSQLRQAPHQVLLPAPSLVPDVPNAEPISARELPCERRPVDLHQKFASRRDEMKRQRGPIAVGSSVPTRNAPGSFSTSTASGAFTDFAPQRSFANLHAS